MKIILKYKNKIITVYKTVKKHLLRVFFSLFLAIILSLVLIPSFSFAAGNIFFGGISSLYNLQIARLLYKSAINPLFSKLPPRYAHYQLSRTYFIEGKLNEALDEVKKELEIYPDDTGSYYILGLTYGYMNRNHEAIDAFSKYIETHPGTWAGRNDKAWLQFRIGDIDGAIRTMEPIAEQFKYTVWVQNTYCALLINKKDFVSAKKTCNYAKDAVNKMTEKGWGHAYPGNDPRIYNTGLQAMKLSIEQNLELLRKSENRK